MPPMPSNTRLPRPRYRIAFAESRGATYDVRVSDRDEAMQRIREAFDANPDIAYADLFTPAGDWSERIPRSSPSGHLVAAPTTDAIPRRRPR